MKIEEILKFLEMSWKTHQKSVSKNDHIKL